jgi:hypothetical protein
MESEAGRMARGRPLHCKLRDPRPGNEIVCRNIITIEVRAWIKTPPQRASPPGDSSCGGGCDDEVVCRNSAATETANRHSEAPTSVTKVPNLVQNRAFGKSPFMDPLHLEEE